MHESSSALIQQFCDGVHWHNLALMGPECTAYYWEPKGTPLNRRSPIHSAFCFAVPAVRSALEDAAPGWHFECILLELQADGHSCGDWAHYFRCRVLAYAATELLRLERGGAPSARGRLCPRGLQEGDAEHDAALEAHHRAELGNREHLAGARAEEVARRAATAPRRRRVRAGWLGVLRCVFCCRRSASPRSCAGCRGSA